MQGSEGMQGRDSTMKGRNAKERDARKGKEYKEGKEGIVQ